MTPPNTPTLNSLRRAISARLQNISTGEGAEILGGRVSAFGYLCICVSLMFLGWLIIAQPWNYLALIREDYWVENLTAALFLLTGVLLFFTAAAERSLWRSCVYILGGIVLVFAAGEELSWGQRIFGFATPDFLIGVNRQHEFNVHNINYALFPKIYRYGGLALCIIACVAFFCRKHSLFAIPLPSILLVLGFIVMASHRDGTRFDWMPYFIFIAPKYLLLLLLGIFALLRGQAALFITATSTAVVVLAVSYMDGHNRYLGKQEMREYMISVFCVFYALELLLAQGAARHKLAALFGGVSAMCMRTGIALPFRRKRSPDASPSMDFLPLHLLAICFIVIVCGIGLILSQYSSARAEAATIETVYRSIASGAYGEPAIRSDFDVYLTDDRLIYYKEDCTFTDTRARFFLRITPVSVDALPDDIGQRWFGTQVFYLDWHGRRFDGKCLGSVPLPEYAIAHIHIGQYNYFERPGWDEIIVVDSGALEALYESIASDEPKARSTFDIYLAENTLTYTKQPCAPADVKAKFFLHIIPADMNDLPGYRKQSGFDNLDFDFDSPGIPGIVFDGKCMATIPLPEYAINHIRTGQYTPDEGQLWKVEFPSSGSAKDAAIEKRYQSIVSGDIGEPTARSTFDIYLAENLLSYAKQPCAPADTEARFFLHIIPADMDDLPTDRKQYEFDNLDFDFGNSGIMFDGKCIVTVPLPEYAITHIRTGQYTPDEGQLWKAEFPFQD